MGFVCFLQWSRFSQTRILDFSQICVTFLVKPVNACFSFLDALTFFLPGKCRERPWSWPSSSIMTCWMNALTLPRDFGSVTSSCSTATQNGRNIISRLFQKPSCRRRHSATRRGNTRDSVRTIYSPWHWKLWNEGWWISASGSKVTVQIPGATRTNVGTNFQKNLEKAMGNGFRPLVTCVQKDCPSDLIYLLFIYLHEALCSGHGGVSCFSL